MLLVTKLICINNFFFLISAINIEKNQIQIEIDENNRRTGYAFVEFQTAEEYAAAFKTDFKAINQ